MNHEKTILESIKYIHSHFNQFISVSDIADAVHFSPSYFASTFRAITGYTVNNYVSQYRLCKVAEKLIDSKERVFVLAYENGFSSQQALTRAFSQQYGMSPTDFRKNRPFFEKFPPNIIEDKGELIMKKNKVELEKIFENFSIVKKEKFYVVGLETDLNYNIKNGTQGICKLYERWDDSYKTLIPDQINKNTTYGITYDNTEEGTAKYMVAVEVSTLANIPADSVVGKCFDACEYAVFDCTLEDETSGRFYQYFFSTFLDKYNLSIPSPITNKKGNTYSKYPCIEVYNSDFKDEKSKIKLYYPIIRK